MFNPNTGTYDLVMVGMRHIEDGRHYKRIREVSFAYSFFIRPEPNNAIDKFALAVYACTPGEIATKVGYIKKEQAAELHKRFNLKSATLTGIKVGKAHTFKEYYAIMSIGASQLENLKAVLPEALVNDDWADAASYYKTTPLIISTAEKDSKMNTTVNSVLDKNAMVARNAAFLEAGRIANNQATKLIASKAPLMVRGYVDTPFGKLVVANIASIAASKLRGNDPRLAKLTEAMMTEAWQEVYQMVDIEKMIDEMLSSESIKKALSKLDEPEVA